MASEALVNLSYRGLVLGKRVRLQKVGPRSAYVAHDAPMPVGTELVLTVDESLVIRAEVARVREGDSREGPAGMWLWADAAEQRARAWWDAHVTAEDPHIPEPVGGRIRTEAPVAPAPAPATTSRDREAAEQASQPIETAAPVQSEPQPDHGAHDAGADAGATADAGDTSQEIVASSLGAAGDVDDQGVDEQPDAQPDARAGEQLDDHSGADDDYAVEIGRATTIVEPEFDRAETSELDDEPLELPLSNTHGRQPRGTQVMTAVEIADVMGMPPVLDGEGLLDAAEAAGRQREIRTTHVMSALEVDEVLASGGSQAPSEPELRDGGSAGGKGRKRRSRKRR